MVVFLRRNFWKKQQIPPELNQNLIICLMKFKRDDKKLCLLKGFLPNKPTC